MATIYVDDRPYEVDDQRNLLDVCLTLGFKLPYFCWHPAMGSVGACRQCAVKQFKDETDKVGRLVMACMTPAAAGTRISISDGEAHRFRRMVIEGLMASHPHDCPVCDEGGHCHLQDMTVLSGHDYRRYEFEKRTFRNQYLGPFINHEMNRCIQCYRCVRFYRDYAGGKDFNVFRLRNEVFFGRHADGVLESEFSGNLVEVCPTGVFTDATRKHHYTRKWDQTFAPSVCVHCGVGCNISPGERYGTLRSIESRYNGQVNGYFLCDRGRYGYEFVNSPRRIRRPLWQAEAVIRPRALEQFASLIGKRDRVIGIGSPRATIEANFALRTLVGPERFYIGMADEQLRLVRLILDTLRAGPARIASIRDVETADAALVLGEDVLNTAPRMALALRQTVRQQPMQIADKMRIQRWNDLAVREAVQDARGPLFIATPSATRLDEIARETWRAAPDDIARLGFAVARALEPGAPEVPDLPQDIADRAGRIAEALRCAGRPVIISGPSLGSDAVIQAAANVARALGGRAQLGYVAPESNTFGLALLGGGTLGEVLRAVRDDRIETVIVLENDLFRRAPAADVNPLFDAAHVVALDHLANPTTARAELVLPAGTFAESDGTLVNHETRAQRYFQVYVPGDDIQESWRWLRDAMIAAAWADAPAWSCLDDVIRAVTAAIPELAGIGEAAPPASFRLAGQKVAREPHRFSGRTAIHANINVSENQPPDDPDAPLAFSMEGYPNQPPAPLIPFFWSPSFNSIQSLNRFQEEIAGPLRGGDPGVRLVEPGGGDGYIGSVPRPFEPRESEWLLVPLYHIFGSEELSALSPPVAELAPKPYIALHPDDAARLGQEVEVEAGGVRRRLPVKIEPELPRGVAGVAALEGFLAPVWSKFA